MSKSLLNKLRLILLALTLISIALFAVACSDYPGAFSVEFGENVTFEYMTDAKIPTGDVVDGEGNHLRNKTNYTFTAPSGKVYDGRFPSIFCNEVGTWSVKYDYGGQGGTYNFEVKDTIAPSLAFENVPGDVFVSDGAKFNLPDVVYSDLSKLGDYSKQLTLNGQPAKFYELTNKFLAETPGEYVYTVTGADVYGNQTTISTTWNAKERGWTPSSEDETATNENCLASYNEKGYINSVESGNFSHYWNAKPKEEYLEEYNGAEGVLRVSGSINRFGCVGFMFNMFKNVTEEVLGNRTIVIKLMTDNEIERLWFGSMKWIEQIDGHVVQACESFPFEVEKGEWTYIKLKASDLRKLNYFDEEIQGFSAFQIGFGEAFSGTVKNQGVLYVDYAIIVDQLDAVKNVKLENNTLTWDSVSGADAYEVIEDGVTNLVNENKYTVNNPDAVLTVRAVSENNKYKLSSDIKTPYVKPLKGGYLADFSHKVYEQIVSVNTLANHTASSITAEYLPEFNGDVNVLKVTSITNGVRGETGMGDIVLNLPKACSGGLTVKYMIAKTDATFMAMQQPGTEYGFDEVSLSVSESWQYAFVNYDNQYASNKVYDKIVFNFDGGAVGSENVVYFAIVADGNKILDLQNEQLLEGLSSTLPQGYLADFTNEKYTELVGAFTNVDPSLGAYNEFTAEVLDEFNGEQNVLKIDVTIFSNWEAGFILKLPKNSGGNNIEVKIYGQNVALINFANPDNLSYDGATDYVNEVANKWATLTLDYSAYQNDDCLAVYILANPQEAPTTTIYVSYVKIAE